MTIEKFYDRRKAKSYNRLFTIMVMTRSVGKSYQMKEEVITNFIKNKGMFTYHRRTKEQIKETMKDPLMFFKDIQGKFPNHELTTKGNVFYCNKEVMGYAVPISSPGKIRGASYHNVTTIWFDEFISIGSSDDRYQNIGSPEPEKFMNICDTIIRDRDNVKIFMLGNNHTAVNPYYEYFNISPKIGERFTVYKDIVIDMFDAKVFTKEREKTSFGRFIRGVEYGTFSLDNQSIVDTDSFIIERKTHTTFLFNLRFNRKEISVFQDNYTGMYYCSDQINKDYKGKVVFDKGDIREDTKFCKRWRDTREVTLLKLAFDIREIYYDDQIIKQTMFDLYRKVGIM